MIEKHIPFKCAKYHSNLRYGTICRSTMGRGWQRASLEDKPCKPKYHNTTLHSWDTAAAFELKGGHWRQGKIRNREEGSPYSTDKNEDIYLGE